MVVHWIESSAAAQERPFIVTYRKTEANKTYLESVKVLLKHGANPNLRFRQNNNNRSAIELAMSRGLDRVVALLNKQPS